MGRLRSTELPPSGGPQLTRVWRGLKTCVVCLMLAYTGLLAISLLSLTPPGQRHHENAGTPECRAHLRQLSGPVLAYCRKHKHSPSKITDLLPYVDSPAALHCVRGQDRPYELVTLPDGGSAICCRWHWFVRSSSLVALLRDFRTYYAVALLLCPDGQVRTDVGNQPILRCVRPIIFGEVPPDHYDALAYECLRTCLIPLPPEGQGGGRAAHLGRRLL